MGVILRMQGWSMQTFNGTTVTPEQLDEVIYRWLYVAGSFLLVLAISMQFATPEGEAIHEECTAREGDIWRPRSFRGNSQPLKLLVPIPVRLANGRENSSAARIATDRASQRTLVNSVR